MISTKVTAVLRRRWPILAIAFAIGVLAGAVSSQLAPSDIVQQYRAEQVVVANSTGTGGVSVQQDSLKVTRGEIPTIAAEAMGNGVRGDQLASEMSVTVDTESQAITIASVNINPDIAAQRVNAVTTAFLDDLEPTVAPWRPGAAAHRRPLAGHRGNRRCGAWIPVES